MSKMAHIYRELIAELSERLRNGERDIDKLVARARARSHNQSGLSEEERHKIVGAVYRDLKEFARSYRESQHELKDSVFMRVIKESLWQELADITDKTQLEWHEIFADLAHHGVYHSGEVVGLGNLVCEKCHFPMAFYTPEILPPCPEYGCTEFQRRPFRP